MKFTQNKQINEKIESQLNIVCKEILNNVNAKSIILAGSFGYGEGPVKIKKEKIYPFNDYDIHIITEKPISSEKIDEIASKAANKIGYKGINYFYNFKKEEQTIEKNFYIDLKCITLKQLRNLPPRLKYYNFKESTQTLYGEDLTHLAPKFQLDEIPLSEPAKLLLDRMSQLVEYYSLEKKYDKEFLTYIIQQAYTACLTSLLMLSKNYKPKYSENSKIFLETYKKDFPELYKKLPDLHLKINKYVKWKLNPQKLPYNSVEEEFRTCTKSIYEVSKYFFSKFLNKKIETLNDLSNAILKMSYTFYSPYLKYKFKIKPNLTYPTLNLFLKHKYLQRIKIWNKKHRIVYLNKYPPDSYILASVPYFLLAVSEKEVNEILLNKGTSILKRVYPVKSKNWEQISLDYANAYIGFFLMKL